MVSFDSEAANKSNYRSVTAHITTDICMPFAGQTNRDAEPDLKLIVSGNPVHDDTLFTPLSKIHRQAGIDADICATV